LVGGGVLERGCRSFSLCLRAATKKGGQLFPGNSAPQGKSWLHLCPTVGNIWFGSSPFSG